MEFKGTRGSWELKHSESKNAWNVVGTRLGVRYKIARLPYFGTIDNVLDKRREYDKLEQKANALLISKAPEMLQELISKHEYLEKLAMLIPSTEWTEKFRDKWDKEMHQLETLIKEATNI